MDDVLGINTKDHELLAEIDLATELMIAAADADGPLDNRRIDAILGVGSAP